MYIVAIAWIYVTLLMATTESSITAGVLTFLFYGVLPCALFLWIFGTPQRHRRKLAQHHLNQPDGADTKADQ
jgi:TRAP-type C4-dicarboxylate transport system permease small subunit